MFPREKLVFFGAVLRKRVFRAGTRRKKISSITPAEKKKGRKKERKKGRKEGRKERKEERKKGRKGGRKEGRKKERKKERKEGRDEVAKRCSTSRKRK